ncbi:7621_t:CDS:2 [Acaulospora colombiana]|uniref:7621_t:CDS:1 n=1 Tax=Acaulospora colombiana TaxID=27376 RepID=A0ACA9M8E6_9GLOM|nr:7621_t:CDS:2 [Acaulospora colombiana]
MKYHSTRGSPKLLSFSEAVLVGLAEDGGLFIPQTIPTLPPKWRSEWSGRSFNSLALEIFSLYIAESEIPRADLESLITKSYSVFKSEKDVALQFLGNLFEYLLEKRNEEKSRGEDQKERITILGATSGDTGSAAIYGLRGKKDISVFILHPRGKVSPIQEAQMTTILDRNAIVKTLFSDVPFNQKNHLGAINSINWARILAQIVYYFHSYFELLSSLGISPNSPESFDIHLQYVVPTGNFGDVLAGYYAKRMGLPIEKLIVSTNSNDILDRFFKSGRYEKVTGEDGRHVVHETLSPAMDIIVSSNFERLLWYLAYETIDNPEVLNKEERRSNLAGSIVDQWMKNLKTENRLVVNKSQLEIALRDFGSAKVTDKETMDTISRFYSPQDNKNQISYILDPHTAVGVAVAERQVIPKGTYQICLATAHPAKFSSAVMDSLNNFKGFEFDEILPEEFVGLLEKEKKIIHVERADPELVKQVIEKELEIELGHI